MSTLISKLTSAVYISDDLLSESVAMLSLFMLLYYIHFCY